MQGAFKPIMEDEISDKFELLLICLETVQAVTSYLEKSSNKALKDAITNPDGSFIFNNMLYDKDNSTNDYQTGYVPANYMIDKWGYFYSTNTKLKVTDPITDFSVGTPSLSDMKTLINAAITRVDTYKRPWDK